MPVQSYFPTTVWTSRLPATTFKRLNPLLLREAYLMMEDDRRGVRWSKKNYPAGYTSYSSIADLPFRSSNFDQLKKNIDRAANQFAKTLDFDFTQGRLEMCTCWLNVMGKYSHHSFHLHPQSALSGTYYVQVPPGSGGFKLEDPRIASYMGSPPRTERASRQNKRYILLDPKPGMILLFESWLKHEVPANLSSQDRVSVSFNYHWISK